MENLLQLGTDDGVMSFKPNKDGEWALKHHSLKGHYIWVVVTHPENIDIAFAGTRDSGLFSTHDGGATWQNIGEHLGFKYVRGLAIHPNAPNRLYVGSKPADVFIYDVERGSWESTSVRKLPSVAEWTFPEPPHIPHVKHMSIDPTRPCTIYAAIEEGWIAATDDAGKTWRELKNGLFFDTHMIVVDPNNSNRLYCPNGHWLYQSDDRGESWKRIAEELSRRYLSAFLVNPSDSDHLLLSATDGPPPDWFSREKGADAAIYQSYNGGLTWEEGSNGIPDSMKWPVQALVVDPANKSTFYMVAREGVIWHSQNSGADWEVLMDNLPNTICCNMVAIQ